MEQNIGQKTVERYIDHLDALITINERRIEQIQRVIQNRGSMYGRWLYKWYTPLEQIHPKNRKNWEQSKNFNWATDATRYGVQRNSTDVMEEGTIEHDGKTYRIHDKLSRKDPVYQLLGALSKAFGSAGYNDDYGYDHKINSKVSGPALREKILRRKIGEPEYKSLMDETHPLIQDAKKSEVNLDEQGDWRPSGKTVWDLIDSEKKPQKPGEPTNPTEERPSILFGDSTEYKGEMKKLAEKFGGKL